MKHLLVTIFIYLTASVSLFGQINYSYGLEDTLFKEGVHFENLNLILPWNFDVTDTFKYGKPVVKRLNKRTLLVKWDTVKILNGITVSFEHYPYRNFLTKGKYSKLTTLYGTINSDDFVKLKQIFDKYVNGEKLYSDEGNSAGYNLKYCNIKLGRNNKRLGNYLYIQKRS